MSPPNILFILSDQHSRAVAGCYGHHIVQTPSLDALAHSGLVYDNAFCAYPLCSPSRAACLTGTHPHTNGVITHINSRHRSGHVYRQAIRPGIRSLVHELREAGYWTHGCGFMHVDQHVHNPYDPFGELGFSSYGVDDAEYGRRVGEEVKHRYNRARIISEMWEHSYRNVEGEPFPYPEAQMWDSLIAEDGLRFLDERDPDRPFFLYTGFRAPHPPWCAPPRFHELYDPRNIGDLPNYLVTYRDKPRRVVERVNYYELWNLPEEMIRTSIAAYFGLVSYMDDCVGRLVQGLEERGLRENTLIVYAADHGEMLYRNGICEKHTFFEDAVRIPLIFSQPGTLPEGERTDAMVSNIDLLPTMLQLADVPVPGFVEGRELTPTFAGGQVQDHVFAEYYHSLDPCRMVRDRRWKYIHTEEDICELYDLEHDPDESINLAWYPQYAPRVRRMHELLMADWEIPQLPVWAPWNDLNERKQRLRLSAPDIIDPRPRPPEWIARHVEED